MIWVTVCTLGVALKVTDQIRDTTYLFMQKRVEVYAMAVHSCSSKMAFADNSPNINYVIINIKVEYGAKAVKMIVHGSG